MPCTKCDNGEIQCAQNADDLCRDSGGWNKAGAICLQFWTKKRNGNCVLLVDVIPQDTCGGDMMDHVQVVVGAKSGAVKAKAKATKGKKK